MKRLLRSLIMMVVLTLTAACMQAQTCPTPAAELTSPTPGSTLVPNPITGSIDFAWCNASADYFVTIESVPGAHDIFFAFTGGAGGGAGQNFLNLGPACASIGPSGCIPSLGETIFFTLQTVKNKQILGTFQYTFTAPGTPTNTAAVIVAPTPGSALTASELNFSWSENRATETYLQVGSTLGGQEFYSAGQGANVSTQVIGLPTNGSPVFARLWSNVGGSWSFNDYNFVACTGCTPTKASMTTPATGSTLTASEVTFSWSTSLATQYYLQAGMTVGGQEIFSAGLGPNLSALVSGLPIGGQPVFVRLWSNVNGAWLYNDYSYQACTGCTPTTATMSSPGPGTTLTSTIETFNWGSSLASEHYLQVGTTPGGQEIASNGEGTNLSDQVMALPNDNSKVFVRLWSRVGSAWFFNDYSYNACAGCIATKAAMASPVLGATLTSTSPTFTWKTSLASQTYLQVGRTQGGQDIYSAGQGLGLSTVVSGVPNDGSAIFVRLWTNVSGAWLFNDYNYKACSGCQ